jgi:hypothetical protein
MAKEWIESLRPGDLVIHQKCERKTVATVKRISPKAGLITLECGARFDRSGFSTMKDVWRFEKIHEATQEALAAIKHKEAVDFARATLYDYACKLKEINPREWRSHQVNQIQTINRQLKTILEELTDGTLP